MTIVEDAPTTTRREAVPDGVGRGPADPLRSSMLTAEVALGAVSVVAVLGLVRLFTGSGYLVPALSAVVLSHVLAAVLRRLRVPGVVAVLVGLGGLALYAPFVLYLSTSRFGLPGADTWHAMATDLQQAWDQFGVVKAPTEALPGFVLAAVAAAWVLAMVADLVAFRLAGTWEALVPAGSLFVFTSALAAERWRVPIAVAFLATSVVFVLAQRGLQAEGSPGWLNPGQRPLAGVLLRAGAAAIAVTVVAAVIVGPLLPGAGDGALLDAYDGSDSNSRVTLSPLVDIQGRLTNQSDVEAFEVVSSAASYWRLTALDDFDGRIWSSNNKVTAVDGALPGRRANSDVTEIDQTFTISGLDVIWLPAAYRPVEVSGTDVSYDTESGSLVTSDSTAEGQTYEIRSEVPQLDAATLAAVPSTVPTNIAERYLALPGDFPDDLKVLAQQVTAGATGTYDRALRLQDWFRANFKYDLTVDSGHGDDAIERFLLETRAGYCEQFAGSFAALARSLGIPARVAVGFTPGEEVTPGTYVVRGRNAHAWPEVWFAGIGWVPFEPTPQRGIPGAQAYTGLAAEQEPNTPTTSAPSTTAPINPDGTPASQIPDDLFFPGDVSGGTSSTTVDDPGSPWPGRLLTTGLVLVLVVALAASVGPASRELRRRRRLGAVHTDADRVCAVWAEVEDALGRSGVRSTPADTPREVAERAEAAHALPVGMVDPLVRDVTSAQWDPAGVGPERVAEAQAVLASVEAELRAPLTWRERLWRHVDPRSHRTRVASGRRAVREPEHGLRH